MQQRRLCQLRGPRPVQRVSPTGPAASEENLGLELRIQKGETLTDLFQG